VPSAEPTTFVALLRGINVGKAKPVSMAELRAAVEAAGFQDVATLLRSGNVVLRGAGSPASMAETLEAAILRDLGVSSRVVVRTGAELAAAIEGNPFPDRAQDGSRLHVMFLATAFTAAEDHAIDEADFGDDKVAVAGREVYAWYANGMSGSDTATRLARLVKTLNTDRNWNTVLRIQAAVEARGQGD
jgi:uncharacterized protein (DUF1697 family)